VRVELSANGPGSGPPERDFGVLRIAHEAIHNALRHADASKITVRLREGDGRTLLEVADDGSGFDPSRRELRSKHLGLTSMEERARELGGRLEIRSAPGSGTTVALEVPGS
jgi:signal transduction histidine kinase